jgi:hypothetical protein
MRLLRALTIATGFALVLSQQSSAQGTRQFKDAWFWGLKTGATSYSSATTSNGGAPLIGAEWLITRTKGGLYLSLDQAFITTTGSFRDKDSLSVPYERTVGLNNLRRFTVAGMIFPAQTRNLHPYAGAGFVLNQVGGVALAGAPTTISNDSISAKKAAFSPIFIGGVQARFKPMSCSCRARRRRRSTRSSTRTSAPTSSRSRWSSESATTSAARSTASGSP